MGLGVLSAHFKRAVFYAYTALIISLTHYPNVTDLGIDHSFFAALLEQDSMLHFFVFGSWGAVLFWSTRLPWKKCVFLGAYFGVVDELTQGFIPGRSPELADWCWDIVGIGSFVLLAQKILSYRALKSVFKEQTIS